MPPEAIGHVNAAAERLSRPSSRVLSQLEARNVLSKRAFLTTTPFLENQQYVNQERASQELTELVTHGSRGTLAYFAEPVGTGKSSLIVMTRKRLAREGFATEDEMPWINLNSILRGKTPGGVEVDEILSRKPKVLFAQEFDLKFPKEKIERGLEIVGEMLGERVPIVVLVGDFTLLNPDFRQIAAKNATNEPQRIALAHLTLQDLQAAFLRRLQPLLQRRDAEIDPTGLFDPEFAKYLVPWTDPPVFTTATMRSAFGLLDQMIRSIDHPREDIPLQFLSSCIESICKATGGKKEQVVGSSRILVMRVQEQSYVDYTAM